MSRSGWKSLFATSPRNSKRPRHRIRTRPLATAELLEARHLLTTFVVDTRFDVVDPNDGATSLREAIAAANDETANPGHDTIEFDPSLEFAMISNQFIRCRRERILATG